jgi:hypothetical protein
MFRYHFPILALLLLTLAGNAAKAQDHPEHKSAEMDSSRHHEAHVHGIAELLVVLEGEQLDIELHSPAMNLLGFEHRASTPEQRTLVKNISETLANGDHLFSFGSAQCQLIDHDVNIRRLLDESDHHEEHGHSDIEAHYRYRCEQPNTVDSLATLITTEFPGIESLQAQWIINGRQGAATLDNIRRELNFQ